MRFLDIDIKTVIVMLCIGNLVVLTLLFVSIKPGSKNSIKYFALSKFIQSIAWVLLAFRGEISNLLSLALGNLILFIGFAMESISVVSYKKQITIKVLIAYILSPAVFTFLFLYLSKSRPTLVLVYVSVFAFVYAVLPGLVLLFESGSSKLQKTLGSLYIFGSFTLIIRIISALTATQEFSLFTKHYSQTLTFVTTYLLMLLGSIGFLLLIKEQTEMELHRAATLDGLTGLFNRRAFFAEAEKVTALASRRKEPVSLLMIDLDKFKSINDKFGHGIGDLFIMDFAAATRQQLRNYDIVGRYGGEEFVVLLPNTGPGEAAIVAERLRKNIEDRVLPGFENIKYTASIGISSSIPEPTQGIDMLIKISDKALYAAKGKGRNRIEVGFA
ncbi:MAG: GGDEF domain-containing protein [Deltaproteobacteria bacterium]|nr:GGDEF domain-containing protein [Deltaproteobacteria bacterium]